MEGGNDARPFASRLRRCVSRVAGLELDLPAHSVCATYSAHGPTSLPHVGAVSESCEQMPDLNLQLPEPVSKKSERRNDSREIQFSSHASIEGLIVSSKSSARESLLAASR
jgi:hypothetical protein